jgi:hypothetical protein
MGQALRGFTKVHRIEFARQQALEAYERANKAVDNRMREEWLKAGALWEEIICQYEMLLKTSESESQ